MAHEFRSEDLDRALGQVIHAAGDDESRPILATVLFEGDAEGFRLVAADNYRIAIATLSHEDHSDFGRVPLAREHVPTLRAFLKIRHRAVTLTVARQRLVVTAPEGVVESRIVDGIYPNYSVVIPQDSPVFGVNPAFLVDAAKAMKGDVMKLSKGDPQVQPFVFEGDDYREAIMAVRVAS